MCGGVGRLGDMPFGARVATPFRMKKLTLAALLGALFSLAAVHGSSRAASTQLVGLYPATVLSAADPEMRYRLLVRIPALETPFNRYEQIWAVASVPATGAPPVLPLQGTSVWVEFEGGDPGYPVWTGLAP